MNKQIWLASRPRGEATADNFRLVELPVPKLQPGQVLVRHHYLSLDPYMRGRMDEVGSYAPPHPLDQVMIGGTAGEVIASRADGYAAGDFVVGMGGWQQYQVFDVRQPGSLAKVDISRIPLSAYLGAVGMPGITAWYGLTKIIAPKAGHTVVVSAASGAVGSVVGQLAKHHGARAVGFAGGPEKSRTVLDEYGFDACVDYRAHSDAGSLVAALNAACPSGIDGYFDNVGGIILDAVMTRMNDFGRIAMCGLMASVEGKPLPMATPALILLRRLRMEGFFVTDHMDLWGEAVRDLGVLFEAGQLRYLETISEGIESAPQAFLGLLKGHNLGKQLVRLK
jgi:NADPH-dependent curcumin reductase CurA